MKGIIKMTVSCIFAYACIACVVGLNFSEIITDSNTHHISTK